MRLDNTSVALVTGASSGIGAALAVSLASRGVTVGLVARRKARLEEVLERCKAAAPASRIWAADLGDLELAERVALDAWEAFGHVDVLVNNAGIPKRRHVTELTYAEVEEVMRVNFLSPARVTLTLLPKLLERGTGSIVNVSSVAGRLGNPRESAYSASKFALCGWSEALNVDLWDTPLEVRLINPGAIETEIWYTPGEDAPIYEGDKEAPEGIAEGIVAAIEGDTFEHYIPDMKPFVDAKQDDIEGFMKGAVDWVKSVGRQ
ncbi:MAG: SDR family NAD(P)-dependent oxidoreductase [Acidimicrobiia bacterium]|nr:SDR family NAD(P)-dependent oxidoreductase [Acidimicrobiia bacterium]